MGLANSFKLQSTNADNDYVLGDVIGQGGSSRVYLASKGKEKEKKYVVKIFNDRCSEGIRKNEIAVNIYLGTLAGCLSDGFVMRYERGNDLYNLIPNIKVKESYMIMYKALKSLEALHSVHLIHFDIKPDNIYVTERGEVHILDYGLTRTWDEECAFANDILLVNKNECMGSVYYLAPEMIPGDFSDYEAIDIYSMGVTFYCVIEKKFPYNGDGREYLHNVKNEMPKYPLNSQYPAGIRTLIMRMIDKNPEVRPDIHDCLNHIGSYL